MSSPSGSEGAGQKRAPAKEQRAALRPYLDKLDKFVETTLVPTYTRGERRRVNPPYGVLQRRESELRKMGQREQADSLRQQKQLLPSLDPHDPNYRRIRYLRYADDWLIGFSGPRSDAQAIKLQVGAFLKESLHLTLVSGKDAHYPCTEPSGEISWL